MLAAGRSKLMIEFGDAQQQSIRALFQNQNWIVQRIVDDYTHRARNFDCANRKRMKNPKPSLRPSLSSLLSRR